MANVLRVMLDVGNVGRRFSGHTRQIQSPFRALATLRSL